MINSILDYQQTDEKLRAIEIELLKSEERQKLRKAKSFIDSVPDTNGKIDQRAGELMAMFESYTKKYEGICESLGFIEAEAEDLDAVIYNKKSAEKLQVSIKNIRRLLESLQDEIKKITESYAKLRNQYKLMMAQYKDNFEKYNALKSEKDKEIKEINKQLETKAKKIDAKMFEKYKQKRADKKFPIFYELNGVKCGQCGMELSLSDLDKIKREKIIECENCRHMIYIKE